MKKITLKEFAITQPAYPNINETDEFYVDLANGLLSHVENTEFIKIIPWALLKRIALTLTDYLQDIVSDAGLWRSFIVANRSLYGYTVPFYEVSENYIDYELNREDVRFLVWYAVAMLWDDMRLICPEDKRLIEFADKCYEFLEMKYETAPLPEHFNISRGLDFKDSEDKNKIYNLGNWLFLHAYLMTPAFAMSMRELASDLNSEDPDFGALLNGKLEEAMMNDTTGPLALFTPEWVYLMIEGKLPPQPVVKDTEPHKYYQAFTKATGGKEMMFFDSYEAMNEFFISALGWAKGEEHLAQLKGQHDYTLMVNPEKGLLLAMNVARCIKCSDNPYYDNSYAKDHSFELLTERGLCPGDLLRLILKNNWLPDAHFPGYANNQFVNKYSDFIARTYLQLYYRGD